MRDLTGSSTAYFPSPLQVVLKNSNWLRLLRFQILILRFLVMNNRRMTHLLFQSVEAVIPEVVGNSTPILRQRDNELINGLLKGPPSRRRAPGPSH